MFVRRAMALLIALTALFATTPAAAEDVYRTVILKVPGANDGTNQLTAEVKALPGLDLRDQRWFLEQVKARGMSPKKLLQRPADLRFVMSGSNIAYVLYVDKDDDEYVGQIFADDGLLADSVPLGREFGEVQAAEFRSLFERVLGIETETVEAAETPVGVAEPVPVAVVEEEETVPEKPKRVRDGRGGPEIGIAGRMFKRDLSYAGGNNAVLNYNSALYPGLAIDFAYVLGGVELGPGRLGFWLGLDAGFDSLATAEESVSILHLDTAGGVGLSLDFADIRLGARHVRYTLGSNDAFPTIVQTLVVIGLATEQQLGAVALGGNVELHPWGTYNGSSGRLFGESSTELGFAAGIHIGFAVTETIAIVAGYEARVERSSFSGQGSLDFSDSRGFELVHGPELGVTWHP